MQVRAKAILLAVMTGAMAAHAAHAQRAPTRLRTYANPIDLPYRYQEPGRGATVPFRESADPTMVLFNGRYWLFASHSKGYWHSTDLLHWQFVEGKGYEVDKFAPTVVEMDGKLYMALSERVTKIYVTDDPMTGQWRVAGDLSGYDDPALFLDDDGRLYMYHGLSGTDVLKVAELDRKTFAKIREVNIPQSRDKENRGWEVRGDRNEDPRSMSYMEGSWVNKHKGRYYLQYAGPGTQFKSYADGVLVADNPMGPFEYQPYSPFALKSTGFIAGAGHGSSFKDRQGRWWHAGTMSVSVRFRFERRLGLWPAYFTDKGELITDTYLGDYPHYIDGNRGLTGWMLLSRRKPVSASSALDKFPAENAVDEEVRTWWSARTGEAGEWFQVDLGAPKTIQAVQINFADQDSTGKGISRDSFRYVLEISNDGRSWRKAIDRARSGRDAPHDYQVLPRAQRARFVRIRNLHSPDGSKFSLFDLRVFGNGDAPAPAAVTGLSAARDSTDGRKAKLSWQPASGAEFYVVRLGIRPDLMTQNYQVYDGATTLDMTNLTKGTGYVFTVDAVNERGITRGVATGRID
jgi:hypothetical protein